MNESKHVKILWSNTLTPILNTGVIGEVVIYSRLSSAEYIKANMHKNFSVYYEVPLLITGINEDATYDLSAYEQTSNLELSMTGVDLYRISEWWKNKESLINYRIAELIKINTTQESLIKVYKETERVRNKRI